MGDGRETVCEALRRHLSERGWTQVDLAYAIGKTTAAVSEIIQGKRTVSPEIAALLAAAFDTDAAYWLALTAQRVRQDELSSTRARSRMLTVAPVREMIRRHWIQDVASTDALESELKAFFRVDDLDVDPQLSVVTRKSGPETLTPAQRAWCFRAKNLGSDMIGKPFDPAAIESCVKRLRLLTTAAAELRQVARTLNEFGIRFVVVEPLSGTRVDGATMWADEQRPIIAMSLRLDRIDNFWFTLFHELSHVRHGDALSVDDDLTGESAEFSAVKIPTERRADTEASEAIVPPDKLVSFIRRVGPLYSKKRIIQFAHRVRVHPGLILGQLQCRGEIPYRANREMLAKIRDRVAPSSLTDGWGHTV